MTIQSTSGHNHKVSSTRTRKYAPDNRSDRTFMTQDMRTREITHILYITHIGGEIVIDEEL